MDIHEQIEAVQEALRFVANRTISDLQEHPEVLVDHQAQRLYWISGEHVWCATVEDEEVDIESTRPVGYHEDPFQAGWDHQIAGTLWRSNGQALRALTSESHAQWIYLAAGLVC